MCGIAGWIDWEINLVQQRNVIEAMTATLTHRGPDNQGMWLSSGAALGHRRLIVVDPEGGGQPMVRQHNGHIYIIVYNGELYNTDEIRQKLKYMGYTFQSRSDTEVLLVSFIAWGPACLQHLNGIFAFAIWDDTAQSLFMARDRLGVKPCIVEYVWNIPWDIKYYNQREKGILRHALTGLLPEDILWRKKNPYPKTHHPAYLEAVRRWVLDILNDPSSPLLPLINTDAVRSIAQSNMDTFDLPWFGQLMAGPQLLAYLAQIDTWLKDYKGASDLTRPTRSLTISFKGENLATIIPYSKRRSGV